MNLSELTFILNIDSRNKFIAYNFAKNLIR